MISGYFKQEVTNYPEENAITLGRFFCQPVVRYYQI